MAAERLRMKVYERNIRLRSRFDANCLPDDGQDLRVDRRRMEFERFSEPASEPVANPDQSAVANPPFSIRTFRTFWTAHIGRQPSHYPTFLWSVISASLNLITMLANSYRINSIEWHINIENKSDTDSRGASSRERIRVSPPITSEEPKAKEIGQSEFQDPGIDKRRKGRLSRKSVRSTSGTSLENPRVSSFQPRRVLCTTEENSNRGLLLQQSTAVVLHQSIVSRWKYWNRFKIENRNGASLSYTHLLRITSRTSFLESLHYTWFVQRNFGSSSWPKKKVPPDGTKWGFLKKFMLPWQHWKYLSLAAHHDEQLDGKHRESEPIVATRIGIVVVGLQNFRDVFWPNRDSFVNSINTFDSCRVVYAETRNRVGVFQFFSTTMVYKNVESHEHHLPPAKPSLRFFYA
ncbi:unnamed protein product [Nesidiocoris tenuis]|uniref:Uncharacterized protein n=1 Tax=Nesidiocoris tenuis TaxID=355587 RepID=A0A6H5HKC8_9HEMI|nr:unnamed protein product [Nesidiocoris tenuis]CAB0018000.1 unnamed protein product [Nesidiocoris tenuis]